MVELISSSMMVNYRTKTNCIPGKKLQKPIYLRHYQILLSIVAWSSFLSHAHCSHLAPLVAEISTNVRTVTVHGLHSGSAVPT